jgi:hypothetical protein
MRISGTLLDRLIIKILPLCLAFGLVFYLTTNKTLLEFAKPFGAAILWLFDSMTILAKKIKRLSIKDNYLTFGKDVISFQDILSITPRKDKRRGIDIKTIEIEYLKDGSINKKRTITKPTFLDLFGKKFKTVDILVDKFPNLRDKVMDETEE